jgi:hypothetical protein
MLPLIMAICGAAGAVAGVLTTKAANEKNQQAFKRYEKVNAELINSRDKLQQRYYELSDRSQRQIKDLNLELAKLAMEKDALSLAVRLQSEIISLMESIDKNPSLEILVEFKKAIALTNYVLKQLNENSISISQDYFSRTLVRVDRRNDYSQEQLVHFMSVLMNPEQDIVTSLLGEFQNEIFSEQYTEVEEKLNCDSNKDCPQIENCILQEDKIDESEDIIQLLKVVPGMTSAHHRDFPRSELFIAFQSGMTIRTWRNPVNVLHVFVADEYGELIFGGFVGWIHTDGLLACLREIRSRFKESLWFHKAIAI